MQTVTPTTSPRAIRKYSSALAMETLSKSYWTNRFIGEGDNNVIEVKNELESDAGDKIQFDLSVQLRGAPVVGDDRAKGKEENLRFYTDEIVIDQVRKPVSMGGRMTRKRSIHNNRKVARARLSEYFSEWMDQLYFMTLSGARGINEDFHEAEDYNGHANPFLAPDAAHILYGGAATSKATLTAADKMTRTVIEKANNKAEMMRARDPDSANLLPVRINGANHYVIVMSPDSEFDLRTDTGSANWLDIQKAASSAEGSKNKIFKGGLGMIGDTVLHKHKSVIRFNDYGAGANVHAARSLFLGRQAGILAYGTPNKSRMQWEEEQDDYKNLSSISGGMIMGVKKSRFNGKDFGIVAIDTAAKDPNAA